MSFRVCGFKWDRATYTMRLLPRYERIAREQFHDGEEYPLEVREQRSSRSHAYYFASVNEAFENLRGETAEILNTRDLLRGWALVEAGWHDQHIIEATDKNAAMRMAVFARAISKNEGYSEIKVIRNDGRWFVRIRTPKSQSRAAMNKEDFEASKRDVLAILSGTIEVTRKQLEGAGKRSAE